MSETLRMAIAGIGLAGRRHADAIDQLPGITLCAIMETDKEGQNYAANLNIPCHVTLDELFAEHSPDGVILATPTTLHVSQGLACIRQGCPVLVEKPLGTTFRECNGLVLEAESKGVPLMVGHHRRFNPIICKAREVISNGEIGNIRAVHINTWFYKPDNYFDNAPWRKKFGAGPISVNLAHDIDLIRYLCGDVETVQGLSAPSMRGYENEDIAAAILKFNNGAIGTVTVSDSIVAPWSWELTSGEYPIYPPTSESSYWIGGSHGSLSLPDLRLWTHREGLRDWWTPISATSLTRGSSDPLVNQISHFADVIRGKSKPLVSGREGLQSLKVIEAIQTACRKGIVISIDDYDAGVIKHSFPYSF